MRESYGVITTSLLQATDTFTKTSCYHYFHVSCMAHYVDYYDRQLKEHRDEEARVDSMLRKKPKQVCQVYETGVAQVEGFITL